MKKILITGKNSYVGSNLEKWLGNYPDKYLIETITLRDDSWMEKDFSQYDVIFHVAGIAHVSTSPKMENIYYKINRDLAVTIAQKAKSENVKQFIFMSSMIIYGEDGKIGEKKVINSQSKPCPIDFYGKSKLEADLLIQKMNDVKFKTAIVRAPMVYGPNCKGNFPKLKLFAKRIPIFPDINNERNMIYIDNLSEFIKNVIDKELNGVFLPQNNEYASTKKIIETIANNSGKKVYFIKVFNPLLTMLSRRITILNKVFGNRVYEKQETLGFEYCVIDFESSIKNCM